MDRWYHTAKELESRNEGFVLATVVRAVAPTSAKPGDKAVVTEDGVVHGWIGGSCAEPTVKRESRLALEDGECRIVQITPDAELPSDREGLVVVPMTCYSGGALEIYLEPHPAKPELVVFGNSPVAQALVELGSFVGYRATVVDSTERPPLQDARVIRDLGDVALKRPSDAAIVIATHGVFDEDAIARAIELAPGYLGVVASPRRFASLGSILKGRGVTKERWARIDGPAGLDIGAHTPQEIAVSIVAAITARRESIAVTTKRPDATSEERARTAPSEPASSAIEPAIGTAGKGSCCND